MKGVGYRISGKVPDLARWNHARLGLGIFGSRSGMRKGHRSCRLGSLLALLLEGRGAHRRNQAFHGLGPEPGHSHSRDKEQRDLGVASTEVGDSRLVLCQRPLCSVVSFVRSCGAVLAAMQPDTDDIWTGRSFNRCWRNPSRRTVAKTFLHEVCRNTLRKSCDRKPGGKLDCCLRQALLVGHGAVPARIIGRT